MQQVNIHPERYYGDGLPNTPHLVIWVLLLGPRFYGLSILPVSFSSLSIVALRRPPFAADRLAKIDDRRLIYHLPKPSLDGQTRIVLSPLELIGRIAALAPPPRQHRHRYYSVLAPNPPLRMVVTALAPELVVTEPTPQPDVEAAADDPPQASKRSPARYLCASQP
jgi:hypothetical protein